MTSKGMSVNDLEIDFISSLKALMVRYGVEVSREESGLDDDEQSINFWFTNDVTQRKDEIYLSIDEIFEYLKSGK